MTPQPEDYTPHICAFGKHKGTPYTRIPLSYLRWMINIKHDCADLAKAELTRRGATKMPNLEVSSHALDRASTKCIRQWYATRKEGQGIHSWLIEQASKALELGRKDAQDRYIYNGMRFAFTSSEDTHWPILKTVIPLQNSKGN